MINWKLLRKQKLTLLKTVSFFESLGLYKEAKHLSGIVNLIDGIQDTAVDTGEVTSREVFGKGF